jgi:S1-C subfamily serine protease
MAINPIVTTVAYIQQLKSNSIIGTATGFFYSRNNRLFLVTNRHVVRDEQSGTIPDTLRLLLHRDPNNISNNGTYDITLYSSDTPLWKDYPTHQVADVALLELDANAIQSQFFVKAWSASAFLPGEDVFIIGYPRGFFDPQHNLPVFRNAMIASVYGVPFRGDPCFLTDANLHPGTSGSPVITKPKSRWVDSDGNTHMVTGNPYYIVGIHSGTYSVTLSDGTHEPLGLGVAWYIQIVEDIAELF